MGKKSATEKFYKEIKNRYNSTFDKTFVDAKEAERVNANLSEIIAENDNMVKPHDLLVLLD